MDSIILDPIPYRFELDPLRRSVRVREGSDAEQDFLRLVEAALAVARPKATYRMAFIETREEQAVVIEGVRFTSRVLRVNLDTINRVFAFVATSGREVEAWAEAQDDFLARFWADAINQAVLKAALTDLRQHLSERFAVDQLSTMNPGSLADWPLAQQRPLFELLGDVDAAIGVALTPSLLMTPTKSVSGIFFPAAETFASCQLCPREACPNRRAPYDSGLFARKYADVSRA